MQGPGGVEKPRIFYNSDVANFGGDETNKRLKYDPRWDTEEKNWGGFTGYAYVLNGDIPVNVIFFARSGEIADWQQNRFQHLITHISGTTYFQPVKKYYNRGYNQGQTHWVNSIRFDRRYYHPCDRDWTGRNGKNGCGTINDQDVTNIITFAVRQNQVSYQKDGIYLFVVGGSIQVTSNGQYYAGQHFCGYHSTYPIDGNWFKYSLVRVHDSCAPVSGTPSGAATDAALYFAMHEMIETITSPNPAHRGIAAGWSDEDDNESMDKCDKAVSGVRNTGGGNFNVDVGGLQYLLPSVFDPALQYCTLNNWFNLRTEARLDLAVDQPNQDLGRQNYIHWRHDGANQKFRWDGEMLRSQSGDNLCLTVRDWGTHNGAQIVNGRCNWQDNQKWSFDPVSKQIKPKFANWKCFDASCNNNGCGVHLWDCHTGSNQRWRFTNVQV